MLNTTVLLEYNVIYMFQCTVHNKVLNCSHCFQGAKDKLEGAKETLEAEKVALEKQVRELTFRLEVRAEDLSKKEVGRQNNPHL